MPTKGDTQINNFVGGLITEASPLTFPPNASIDEVNFKLKRDGTRERRLGIDYEDDYTLHNTGLTAEQLASSRQTFFNWPTPSGNVDVDIGIIQVAGLLFFVDMNTANPSANLLNQSNSIDLGIPNDAKLSYTIINNEVAVVSAALDDPFFLSYNADTDVVTATTETIKIRDIYGVDDSLGDNERPTTLSAEHEYNLRNQGWNTKITTVTGDEVLVDTFNALGEYPSNSDTWSLGKIADVSDADVDKYDPNTLNKNSFDLGRAAKGHFVIDLYDRGQSRSTLSGITLSNSDRELGRPSAVESYAGRLFYSGITSKILNGDKRSPNLSGAVLYSQVGKSNEDLSRCYQEADPTSPTNNDAIDTDGGVIQISGAVDIVMLKTIKTSLFVFASNGIWQIRGDDGGFRSTSFQVNKISSIGVFSPESIVEANGTIFFWAKSGIYSLTPNQVDSTTFDSTNVTITTIQRGYNSLPDLVKQNVKGYYDLEENKVRWLFRSDVPETLVVPDPGGTTEVLAVGTPQTQAATANVVDTIRISDTKYMLVYNNSVTEWVAQIVTVDPITTDITLGSLQTFDSSLGTVTRVGISKMSDTKYLLYTDSATNGKEARILTLSGDVVSDGTPATITFTSGFSYSDVQSVSEDYGVIVSKHSDGSIRFLPLTLTSGTPAAGTEVLSSYTSTYQPKMSESFGSTVFVSAQTVCFSIDVTTTITEDGSALNSSGEVFQGGNGDCHLLPGNRAIFTNSNQAAVISSGDPVSYVSNMEGGINLVPGSQGALVPAGYSSTRFIVFVAYNNSGVSSRSLGFSIITEGEDGNADTILSIGNDSGIVTITDTDVVSISDLTAGNLRTTGNTVFYACVDGFSLDIITGVVQLGT